MRRSGVAGIHCPTLTPVDERGDPCIDLLTAHCRWLLDEGCDGIVLFGTTGEANSFAVRERRAVLDRLVEAGIPTDSLMVGTGCCAGPDTLELTRHALSVGCRRVLVLPPFYYKGVSPQGVVRSYADTIEAIGDGSLRLYLYRIPQMSGVDITPDIIRPLIERYPGIIAGIKDSAGDPASSQHLCRSFASSMDVLVGSERLLLPGLQAGAAGCISATANAFPRLLRALYDRRDDESARVALAARAAYETLPMIAALKEATARRTGDARWRNLRPPLTTLDDGQLARYEAIADGAHR